MDKGIAFSSQLMTELKQASGIKIYYATLKLVQTNGMVGRTHQKLKQTLKIKVKTHKHQWDRPVNIALMLHSTTYHQSIKWRPTERLKLSIDAFHTTHLTSKIANHCKLGIRKPTWRHLSTRLIRHRKKTSNNSKNFHKYRKFCERKTQAQPEKVGDYTFLPNSKLNTQTDRTQFKVVLWNSL